MKGLEFCSFETASEGENW